jgi:alkanesulfonate monooxygenase SsuD/methylene tetrahydromethanopterin reductase-like flavin-dependent oxidoreductase (luciferase family)
MSRRIPIGIKTSPQAVTWAELDTIWAKIGEHEVFESVWMNDHLADMSQEHHGASLESFTAMATLAHRVPGRWLGHAVLSATFRHPSVLAKSATVLADATGGRYILGLGAGWHEGEHVPFGIPMPPMPERFDRFESAVHVLRALWSSEAATPPGVTRPDRFYPLSEATNEPPAPENGGPRLWLGGQRRRGIALAAAVADGWVQPAVAVGEDRPSTLDDFRDRRAALVAALESIGRNPAVFEFGCQIATGDTREDRRRALAHAREAVQVGATHLILGMRPHLGPAGVDAVADEIALPLREALG